MNIQKLEQLNQDMVILEANKRELKSRREEFDKQNSELILLIKSCDSDVEILKEDIRLDAMAEYKKTNNKRLLGGIGIRVNKSYNYDKAKAFDWAKSHDLCLSLDDKAFKGLAKTQDFDFVEIEEKTAVTFPKEIKL